MNFLLFFVYYLFSTLILFSIGFILYKLIFKKIIADKLTFTSDFFKDSLNSITNINFEKKEMEEKDEKIPTYF